MKKIVIAFLVIAVMISIGCTTTATSNAERGTSNGLAAAEKGGAPEKVETVETVNTAYVTKDVSYYSDGYIESYKVYSYNDDMTPAREDLFDSFDEIIESVVYENLSDTEVKRALYDARGNLQSWKKTAANESGEQIRVEFYSAEDVLQTLSEYEYDESGNKTAWKVLDGDGILLSDTKYLYEDGLNSRIDIYDASARLTEYFEMTYDGDLMTRKVHYDKSGKIKSSIEYNYDGGMLAAEKHLRANGSASLSVKFTNDDEGSHIKVEYYDGNDKLKDWNTFEYEYVSEEITVLR